jgi:ribosome-binding protein aMBF1 (putative translation factor)
MTYHDLIRDQRLKLSLTQADLAERLDCTRQHIRDMERGRIVISNRECKRIAAILRLDAAALIDQKNSDSF